jgi:hypothetical protein
MAAILAQERDGRQRRFAVASRSGFAGLLEPPGNGGNGGRGAR